jgi:hypothetical protein
VLRAKKVRAVPSYIVVVFVVFIVFHEHLVVVDNVYPRLVKEQGL